MSKCHVMCCVKGCTNRLKTDSSLHFYKFPKKSIYTPWRMEKRNLWIEAVRPHVKIPATKERSDWEPKDRTVICSAHFVNGAKGEHPQDPAYMPTIFPKLKKIIITSNERLRRQQRRTSEKRKIASDSGQASSAKPTEELETERIDESGVEDREQLDYEAVIEPFSPKLFNIECQDSLEVDNNVDHFSCTLESENGCNTAPQGNLQPPQSMKNSPIVKVKKKNELACGAAAAEDTCRGFHGFLSISSEEEAQELCGVKLATFTFLLDSLPELEEAELRKANQLLLFLMKMKLGLSFTCLSVLFNVERTSVARIFGIVLQYLTAALSRYTCWPKKETVRYHLPEAFQENYKNCRVIIDCLEFKIETPVTLTDKNLTWSENKRIYTFKVLIGCTPNGLISFKSKCYAGSTSDKFIVADSGFLDKLESNDLVFVGKKFPRIETKGRKKNSIVTMPSCLPKTQCFQKIKHFHIFKLISAELFSQIDDIVTVACALVNLGPSECNSKK